jgi:hypothetical protein
MLGSDDASAISRIHRAYVFPCLDFSASRILRSRFLSCFRSTKIRIIDAKYCQGNSGRLLLIVQRMMPRRVMNDRRNDACGLMTVKVLWMRLTSSLDLKHDANHAKHFIASVFLEDRAQSASSAPSTIAINTR